MWRNDPFEEMRRIQSMFNRMFDEFWGPAGRNLLPAPGGETLPRQGRVQSPFVDVREVEGAIVVTADMPGMAKEDIDISVENDVLVLSAELKEEVSEERENVGFVRRERYFTRYYRRVPLPAPVDEEKATATLNNGVLEITLPRVEQAETGKKIKVE